MPWQPLPLSYAVAIYPFQPSSSAAELPLQIGDQLYLIEQGGKDGEWCRGYLVAPPSLLSALSPGGRLASDARVFSGIFPKCCIEVREELGDEASARPATAQPGSKPAAPVPMLKIGDESPTSTTEPLVDEISSCLREWFITHLPDLVLRRQYTVLERMSALTNRLDYARRELLNDVLTAQERAAVQTEAVWDLVRGNKMLGAEVIVRDPRQQGRLLTGEDSAIEVAKLQSIMSVLEEAPAEKSQVAISHHCLVEIKSVEGSQLDVASVTVALYQRREDGQIQQYTESYTGPATSKLRTLLADLSVQDVNDDGRLFLAIKITVSEPPKEPPKPLEERPPSRNGAVRGTKASLLDRRRSSLMFASKRKADKDRPVVSSTGQVTTPTVRNRDRGAATPTIPEEGEETQSTEEEKPTKPPTNPVPRLVAVAVVDIARILRSGKDECVELHPWSHALEEGNMTEEGNQVLRQIFPSSTGLYTHCEKVSKLTLDLKPHQAQDSDALIRMNPTSLHQVNKTQKTSFSEAPSKHRSDFYITFRRLTIMTNSQLSHPEYGSTQLRSTLFLNLQLTMELRDGAGKRLEHCIFASANSPGVTALRTNAIEVSQAWDQTICIRVPSHKVAESHLVLSVADAPEFPFALAWMPLWQKQTFIRDGSHSLILHAYDKTTSTFSKTGQGAYLQLPWDHSTYSAGHDGVSAQIAALELETRLCSTEFSQDPILAALFNWKILASAKLMDMLQKLFFVPEIEIVKQFNEVLDKLFAILEHKSGSSKFEDTIFNTVVFVLGIVHDRRYNLGPLVERYTEEHFKAPPIAPCLVRSWTRLLQSVSDPQSSRDLRALFKVGKQFMKLLMCAYVQHKADMVASPTGQRQQSFKDDMHAVLFGLQMLMRNDTAALVGSKTLLVQNFHSWLTELLSVYGTDEVIKIAVNFVDACENARGKLARHKLVLIQKYTQLDQIWIDAKDWNTLIKHCLRWLDRHWRADDIVVNDRREQIRLCGSIVAELAKRPMPKLRECLPTVVATYCALALEHVPKKRSLSLLFPSAYPFPSKAVADEQHFDETLIELSALVSTLSAIETPEATHSPHPTNALTSQISSTLSMVQSMLAGRAHPSSWLSLSVHQHYSAINVLRGIASQLMATYLPEPEEAEAFPMELWRTFFDTLLQLLSSPTLTLESFSEQKRRAVWKIAGDVRQIGSDLLRETWDVLGWDATPDDERRYGVRRLGGYQVQYVPGLVGPVIGLCLSMHEGVRKVAVGVLQTMIISEWGLNEDLDLIETEVVAALNNLLKSNEKDSVGSTEAISRKLFVGELLELFGTIANQPDDALWQALEELVATIDELIDLLSSGQEILDSPHEPRPPTVNGKHGVDLPDRSISRLEGKAYGTQALEVYKQLAEEYERSGDYKRLARTHRAIARIHEARATQANSTELPDIPLNGAMDDADDVEEEHVLEEHID